MTSPEARGGRVGIIAGAVCLLLLAGQTTVWFVASRRLQQGLGDVVAAALADGWQLSFDRVTYAGWPFAAGLDLSNPAITGAEGTVPSGARWHAESLRLRLHLLSPTTLALHPAGQQRFEAANLPALELEADQATVAVPLRLDGPVVLEAAGVAAKIANIPLSLRSARVSLAPEAASATLAGVGLPGGVPEMNSLDGRAALTRPIPNVPGLLARARAWRDGGGAMQLTDIAIVWGPLTATGNGSAMLDEHLQPAAQIELAASGIAPFLDALAHTGLIAPGAATAAKAVVALLAAPAPGSPVRLPVELRNSTLTIARFPLARVPTFDWE